MGVDGKFRRSLGILSSGILSALAIFISPMCLSSAHGASSWADADHAYLSGLLGLAEKAYTELLGDGHDQEIMPRLLEIAVRLGHWEDALRCLEADGLKSSMEVDFWRAHTWLGLGKRREGMAALETFLEAHPEQPLALEASLSLASLYLEDHRFADVSRLLGKWTRADSAKVDFLKARFAVETEVWTDAINRLERMRLNPEGLPQAWIEQIYFDLAEARLAVQQQESAEDLMRNYLTNFKESPHQVRVFALLAKGGAFDAPDARADWLGWSKDQTPLVQGHVLFQIAQAEARQGKWLNSINRLEKLDPTHPLHDQAAVLRARGYLAANNATGCLSMITEDLLKSLSDERCGYQLRFLRGLAFVELGDAEKAQQAFSEVPETADPATTLAAVFNGAATASYPSQEAAFQKCVVILENVADGAAKERLKGEAAFLQALVLAKDPERQTEALRSLAEFAIAYPEHERLPEAQLARAELALSVVPPKLTLALEIVTAVKVSKGGEAYAERADYLEIWQASLAEEEEKVLRLGESFFKRHPQSSLIGSVRLRRAEVYYASDRFANAAAELDLLRGSSDDSSVAVQARFLKAYALQRLGEHDKAVKEWSELIDLTKGDQQLIARHQQALTLCQQGNRIDAGFQWDKVIEGAQSSDLLFRALTCRGESLTLIVEDDAKRGAEAIAVFDQILAHEAVTDFWHDQAQYRKGMVHQRMNAFEEALTAFNQVIRQFQERAAAVKDGNHPPDPYWFYRAGFEAVSLLEERERWEAAARLADQLADAKGDRSEEANDRAKRIRVVHFLWD